MRPTQVFNLALLVIGTVWAIVEVRKGKIAGRQRWLLALIIGLAALGWVARQMDW